MPTYEYRCSNCGHEFEKFQSIKAAPIKECPACGQPTAQRLISKGGGLIFKGSGFYITDYRSDAYKNSAKSDSAAGGTGSGDSKPPATGDKPSAGASTSGGESKPAAKS